MSALPPGPKSPWPLQLRDYVYRPGDFLDECAERYGDIFTIRLGQAGTLVVLHAPDDVRSVFRADGDVLRAGVSNALARPIVGESSVFVADGPAHARKRRILAPAFRGEQLRHFATAILDTTHRAVDGWKTGQRFPIHRDMYAITLDVILRVVFGLDDEGEIDSLRRALLALFKPTPAIVSYLPQLQVTFPGSPFWFWLRLRTRVTAALSRLIAERRKVPNLEARRDFLSALLLVRDENGQGLPDEELHDELITAVLAGHETTATVLSWVFERVLVHPEVEARLESELATLPESALDESPYLEQVLYEVLRQRPPFALVARGVCAPWRLGEWELPEGVIVAPCLYLTHKRNDAFPNAKHFEPERWAGKKPDPFLFYPFGGGIRRCLGMAFALFEMKLIVGTVLRRARLRLAAAAPLATVRRTLTLFPEGGARVVVEELR
jgi:cytochrome P450